MRHGTELPTLALFFGLAGGLEAFGPLGIFLGPAIIAVFAALLKVYRRNYVREAAPEVAEAVQAGKAESPASIEAPLSARLGEEQR
jgi:predicted PurR-regulated permease PerM